MTRRVVVTGLGIVSSLGNNKKEVKDSLYHARSGITFQPDYAAMGLRSHVAGSIKNLNLEELIDRKLFRFMAKAMLTLGLLCKKRSQIQPCLKLWSQIYVPV